MRGRSGARAVRASARVPDRDAIGWTTSSRQRRPPLRCVAGPAADSCSSVFADARERRLRPGERHRPVRRGDGVAVLPEPVWSRRPGVQRYKIDGGYVLVDVKPRHVQGRSARLTAPRRPRGVRRPRRVRRELRAPSYTTPVGTAQTYAAQAVAARGWAPSEFSCLVNLWNRESGWNTHASNPSGAYGIPQALPGSKMAAPAATGRTATRRRSPGASATSPGRTAARAAPGRIRSLQLVLIPRATPQPLPGPTTSRRRSVSVAARASSSAAGAAGTCSRSPPRRR